MRKMIRFMLLCSLAVGTTASMVASPQTALACDCADAPSVTDALGRSDAVFAGTIVRQTGVAAQARRQRRGAVEVRILVTRAWKGVRVGQQVSIWEGGSTCATSGQRVGNELFFFASARPGGGYLSLLCDQPEMPSNARTGNDVARWIDAAHPVGVES